MKRVKPTLRDAYRLFHDGVLAFAQMEHNGIAIDVDYMDRTAAELDRKVRRAEDRMRADPVYGTWRKRWGERTNLGSRVQLAEVLFNVMKLPSPGYTDRTADDEYEGDRRYKTDKLALEKVELPFVRRFLKCENLKGVKVKLDGIRREVVDGLLHPVFNLHFARTYRSSSDSPNFQSIHNRDKMAAETIRRGFVPRPGNVLVENDFAAHEFKIAASRWDDPAMITYASDKGKDIHRDTGAELFACDPDQVSKDMRQWAKNLYVFRTLYGGFYPQSSQSLWAVVHNPPDLFMKDGKTLVRDWLRKKGITDLGECDPRRDPRKGTYELHVRGVDRAFMARFPHFAKERTRQYEEYLSTGRFDMLTGFRVEGVYSRNDFQNYGIQGPAFHCLLWVLVRLQRRIKKYGKRALVIGQIHDCVLGDVPRDEVQWYIETIRELVEVRLPRAFTWLKAPLEIECEVCEKNWWDKKPWVRGADGVWGAKA